jgi:hypothetical protein
MLVRHVRRGLGVAVVGVFLALGPGCQRIEEAEDDDGGSGPSTDGTDVGGGTFIETTGGDPAGEAEGEAEGESDCDPIAQSGCPAGEKCAATASGGSVVYTCVDDSGGVQPFESCTPDYASGIDGCVPGYGCLGDVSGAGLCVQHCRVEADCTQGDCILDAGQRIPYCAAECSPFEPACPAPMQCRRDVERFSCKFALEGDVGGRGDPCSSNDDGGCGAGFVCIPGALIPGCTADNCCTDVCDLSGPDPCTSPAICAMLLQSPAPGFEDVGACFVPT